MESPPAPTGPGWVKLSEKTYMNNLEPVKDRTLVYKGKQNFAGQWRHIAVKLIAYDEKSQNEVQLHLKLEDHPNIIRMYDAGVTKQPFSYIYIAMELCSQTLKEFIEERKDIPLDFQRYFDFAKQIVSAVAFIHKSEILHRDLKLENVLVSPSKDNIRVADLGLSKQLLEGHSVATASFRGIGSDGYRAPELLQQKPMASFRSDTFSLGIILTMLFSNGRHPYGTDPARWRTNIVDNKGRDLSNILFFKEPYCHKRAQLVDLIQRCLEYNPRSRPTPSEMLQHKFFTSSAAEPAMPESGRPTTSEGNFDEEDAGDATNADAMEQFIVAKKKNLKKLENDLARAFKDGHTNPSAILKQLNDLSKEDDLDTILPLAEYELLHKKKDTCIERVRRIISETGSKSALDVRQKGYSLQERGDYVQAMILYIIAHDVHIGEGAFSPDMEVKWIHDRVTDISSAIVPLLQTDVVTLKRVARDHGLKRMFELLDELRAVDGATPAVKVLHEMGCLVNITGNTNRTREHKKCIQYGEEGATVMRQQFGENVYYKDYGRMLNNLGNAYDNTGQYSKANDCYSEAIRVKSQATDYKTEEDRQQDVNATQKNANDTLGKMVRNPLLTQTT